MDQSDFPFLFRFGEIQTTLSGSFCDDRVASSHCLVWLRRSAQSNQIICRRDRWTRKIAFLWPFKSSWIISLLIRNRGLFSVGVQESDKLIEDLWHFGRRRWVHNNSAVHCLLNIFKKFVVCLTISQSPLSILVFKHIIIMAEPLRCLCRNPIKQRFNRNYSIAVFTFQSKCLT